MIKYGHWSSEEGLGISAIDFLLDSGAPGVIGDMVVIWGVEGTSYRSLVGGPYLGPRPMGFGQYFHRAMKYECSLQSTNSTRRGYNLYFEAATTAETDL